MEHDWKHIDPRDLEKKICNNCVQCRCHDDYTEECPRQRVPSQHLDSPDFMFIPGIY